MALWPLKSFFTASAGVDVGSFFVFFGGGSLVSITGSLFEGYFGGMTEVELALLPLEFFFTALAGEDAVSSIASFSGGE